MGFNSTPFIFFINFIHNLFSKFSSLCSEPLFSTIVTLYTLILLYVPSFFLTIIFSPIFNLTGILLLFLLKLGAIERFENVRSRSNERFEKEYGYSEPRVLDHKDKHYEQSSNDGGNLTLYSSFVLESTSLEPRVLYFIDHNQTKIKFKTEVDLSLKSNQTYRESEKQSSLDLKCNQMHIEFKHDLGSESYPQDDYYKWELRDTNSMESPQVVEKRENKMEMDSKQVDTTMKFLEWNMKAPLEIIYEAYEGEEEEEDEENNEENMVSSDKYIIGCEKYPSSSMYYPESEIDNSSDDDFPMNKRWETHETVFLKWEEEEDDREELIEIPLDHYWKRSIEFFHDEEDNLIEIDIFPQETKVREEEFLQPNLRI